MVPVFNVARYIRECMDSILGQTLGDIEVICGDGGSTDGTLQILKEYEERDSRVRVISKSGSGYGESVNDCMDVAVGEYIGIVESDDAVLPETFETLYVAAEENNVDWVRADIFLYFSERQGADRLVRQSITYGGDFYNTVLNPQTDNRPLTTGLRTWSGIYRREYLNKYGIRHNETPGGSYQDVGFYLKNFYYANRVYFVDQAFYMWRQDNPGSSIHYDESKLAERSFREWHLNREYLETHPGLGARAYAIYNHRKFFSYRWTVEMTSGDVRAQAEKTAVSELAKAYLEGEFDKSMFSSPDWNELQDFIKRSLGYRWKMFKHDLGKGLQSLIENKTR